MREKDIIEILRDFCHAVRLEDMPDRPGLYGLCDHRGKLSYVGITTGSLHDRIMLRHVGGDGSSHKYSSAYNAGYLWHDHKAGSCKIDGSISKKIRREFARATCRAHAIIIPKKTKAELTRIERSVIGGIDVDLPWQNKRKIDTIALPLEKVMAHVTLTQNDLEALTLQHARWIKTQ